MGATTCCHALSTSTSTQCKRCAERDATVHCGYFVVPVHLPLPHSIGFCPILALRPLPLPPWPLIPSLKRSPLPSALTSLLTPNPTPPSPLTPSPSTSASSLPCSAPPHFRPPLPLPPPLLRRWCWSPPLAAPPCCAVPRRMASATSSHSCARSRWASASTTSLRSGRGGGGRGVEG